MRTLPTLLLLGLVSSILYTPASAQDLAIDVGQGWDCDDGDDACNPTIDGAVVDKGIKPPADLPMIVSASTAGAQTAGAQTASPLSQDGASVDAPDPRFVTIDVRRPVPPPVDNIAVEPAAPSTADAGAGVPVALSRRSTGGRRVLAGEARWQAQIYQPWPMQRFAAAGMADGRPMWQLQHICGGVLIGDGWLLTAAHCLTDADGQRRPGYRVRLGAIDFSQEDGWTYAIDRVERFPLYRDPVAGAPPRIRYDIALVHFIRDAATRDSEPPSTLVRPIALDTGLPPVAGEPVRSTGWGVMAGRTPTPVMMLVKMDVVAEGRCAQLWRMARNPTVVCAGRETVQTCQGDSGGPLVNVRGPPRLIGVVSFNLGTCVGNADRPGVYTRVATPEYQDWIAKITGLPRRTTLP